MTGASTYVCHMPPKWLLFRRLIWNTESRLMSLRPSRRPTESFHNQTQRFSTSWS